MTRLTFIFLFCAAFISCMKNEKSQLETTRAFYSLKAFADREAKQKIQGQVMIRKEVILNGNAEMLHPDPVQWEDELRPLSTNDINKSSWVDKFSKDTMIRNNITTYSYKTTDKKIPVKLLEVQVDSFGQVLVIRLLSQQDNPLMKSSQEIVYRPQFGYRVSGHQKALILKDHTYSIQAEFLPKEKLK